MIDNERETNHGNGDPCSVSSRAVPSPITATQPRHHIRSDHQASADRTHLGYRDRRRPGTAVNMNNLETARNAHAFLRPAAARLQISMLAHACVPHTHAAASAAAARSARQFFRCPRPCPAAAVQGTAGGPPPFIHPR